MSDDTTDNKPDAIAKKPDRIVGRNRYDLLSELIFDSKTGTKLDAAFARVVDWPGDVLRWGQERVQKLIQRVDQLLEEGSIDEPKAIPERVGIEVIENVAREEREELFEWWARLLVGSARGEDVDSYHVDTIKKLNPSTARVLLVLGYHLEALPVAKENFDPPYKEFAAAIAKKSQIEPGQAQLACHRLVALGLAQWDTFGMSGYPLITLSGFGQHLLRLLYPGKVISKVEVERAEKPRERLVR